MSTAASPNGKEPWLAVILSSLFPGLGQFYAGHTIRGWLFVAAGLSLLSAIAAFVFAPSVGALGGVVLLLPYAVLSIVSLFDAHRCARQSNSDAYEKQRLADKKPWLAVFFSRLLPGLGHAYQRQWAFAALFLLTFLGAIALSVALPILAILATAISYLCLYHAYISSPSRRHKSRQLILIVCGLLLVSDLLSGAASGLAEARYIPSGGMEPTLQIGDRLIVDKTRYIFSEPARGDVVVFWAPDVMTIPEILLPPDDRREAFIKRLIGLPGETVAVSGGQVLIDGTPLQEDYILEPPAYEWGPETIPNDAYFVLGDNRNNSFDSHVWGPVPADNVIGQATKRFWPPARNSAIE